MQVEPEITFNGLEKDDALMELVQRRIGKLERYNDHITSCQTVVEKNQEAVNSGTEYRVRVSARVPPKHELVAKYRNGTSKHPITIEQVIAKAFNAMEHQLRELSERQRGEEKAAPTQAVNGTVKALYPNADYGFIMGMDGGDVYFHRASVTNDDFDRLEVGAGVHYTAESGEKGPQASTVHLVDKVGRRTPMDQD